MVLQRLCGESPFRHRDLNLDLELFESSIRLVGHMHQYKNALQPLPIFRSRIFDSGPLRAGADASVRLHRGLQRAQVGRDHAAHHLRVRRRLPENLLNCAQCYKKFCRKS